MVMMASLGDCSGKSQPIQLNLPVTENKAPIVYSDWRFPGVANEKWRETSQLAGDDTLHLDHPLGSLDGQDPCAIEQS
jgi:hypothetical protein